jgi:hypothetical protein
MAPIAKFNTILKMPGQFSTKSLDGGCIAVINFQTFENLPTNFVVLLPAGYWLILN